MVEGTGCGVFLEDLDSFPRMVCFIHGPQENFFSMSYTMDQVASG